MWNYDKKLIYPVKIKTPNPKLANLISSQFGGPHGELGAAERYLNQRYTIPYGEITGILTDVGTEAAILPPHFPLGECGVAGSLCGQAFKASTSFPKFFVLHSR